MPGEGQHEGLSTGKQERRSQWTCCLVVLVVLIVAFVVTGALCLRRSAIHGLQSDLWHAVTGNDSAAVARLLEAGADPNFDLRVSDGLMSPFTYAVGPMLNIAACHGSYEIAKLLLEHGADPNARHPDTGQTPLDCAESTYRGLESDQVIRLLLDHGAEWSACRMPPGDQLQAAARIGDAAGVQQLLPAGAPPNTKGASGDAFSTPLHLAAASNNTEVAEMLLAAGADPNARDQYGHGPLWAAATSGSVEVMGILLEHGADATDFTPETTRDRTYGNLLTWAAERGDIDMARLLLEHDVSPDVPNRNGWTSLHFAVSTGNVEMVRFLLDGGADPNIADNENRTPLDCVWKNHDEMTATLRQHGGRE